ncbi:uncharacterized protein TRAVEDRAFT_54741 [Trametes versicolor FP-101664 SS1]|uniref:Uncharacterized protein n=1 Tax=Trametes versicolor (strain FP-101664) TaxID=717944 RepID=R7S8F6_TRAVS|nr:uncharacterized protein TRAVEDRAFT_54741 [Trametes versicolor FP-101664 SS1]EIW51239.1 hypothetical protein TRAVEDRAFT_54741 [Trametes versicolor FP-101664 SS1]
MDGSRNAGPTEVSVVGLSDSAGRSSSDAAIWNRDEDSSSTPEGDLARTSEQLWPPNV